MSQVSVRLDDATTEKLRELSSEAASQTAAISLAITQAWERLQDRKLVAAYEAAYAEEPAYPAESAQERTALRARRNARQAREEHA